MKSLSAPAVAIAKEAGLRYVSDARPGIARKSQGKIFAYRAPDGTAVQDAETLRRIRSLAIPPAWTEVWICPNENGHIQAVGRDANENNIAITRAGTRCATRQNTGA